ncbi:MAG: hypothetical protein M1825_004867 [Sarcosagium campestre]|nr:MAG: hypothetical protein M1825_004867 [Sarcosagium campestre]
MSWEQGHSFGYANGHNGQPPTPSATPTSATAASFEPAPFQTPKSAVAHFESLFPHEHSPFLDYQAHFDRTPRPDIFSTPQQRPYGSSESFEGQVHHEKLNAQLAAHVHHASPHPVFPLPPVDPSSQLPSSPVPSPTGTRQAGPLTAITPIKTNLSSHEELAHSASSMQTPPPTSIAAGKRKKQSAMEKSRKAPASSSRKNQAVKTSTGSGSRADDARNSVQPAALDQFDFTAANDPFGFPDTSPATAPAYLNHRMFWAPGSTSEGMNIDFHHHDDMSMLIDHNGGQDGFPGWDSLDSEFNRGIFGSSGGPSGRSKSTVQLDASSGFSFDAMPADTVKQFPPGSFNGSGASGSGVREEQSGGVVNPSLLFTSDRGDEGVGHNALNISTDGGDKLSRSRTPYQFQQEELEREEAYKAARRQLQGEPRERKTVGFHSQKAQQVERPRLKRNFTDSSFGAPAGDRAKSQSERKPLERKHSTSRRLSSPTRAASTILRRNQSLRAAAPEASISFGIDASGRAVAKTTLHRTKPQYGRRYGTVGMDAYDDLDDVESDSSSDLHESFVKSRNSSFNLPQASSRRPRFVSPERRHSHRLSQSSTSGSSHRSREYRDDGPRSSQPEYEHAESEAETVFDSDDTHRDGPGDAQDALKKLVGGRSKRNLTGASLPASSTSHHRLSSSATQRKLQYSNLNPYASYAALPNEAKFAGPKDQNLSPATTISDPTFHTPSTGRSSQSGETRCVCNVGDSGEHLMIQCDSCTNWLHVDCVGLNRSSLPPVYVCIYCTGQTPNVRGGRIRDPNRVGTQFATSTSPPMQKMRFI